MKRIALLIAAVAPIAACSGGDVSIQPGQWEDTINITNVEVPGAPPEMAKQIASMAQRQQPSRSHCITPQQAANPLQGLANPTGEAQGCTFTDQTFAGGVIRVTSACPAPTGQGQVRTTLEGTYTATTLEARLNMEGPTGAPAGAGAPSTMRMTGTMTSRRTGDCPS